MKTSRLALGANPCGATHPCASASTRPAQPGRRLSHFAAILWLALIGQTASAAPVNIAWDANPEPDIAGYNLSYGTSPGDYSNTLSTGTTPNTLVDGLNEGQTYYFTVRAFNTAGLESAPSAEVSYLVPVAETPAGYLISQTGWTLQRVNSEKPPQYAAELAFDGDPNTFWHTEWLPSIIPPPHEIQIDLGSIQAIQGFRYLPRQDGWLNGTFTGFEFYASEDGVTWGSPAAAGNLAATSNMKEVKFAVRNARYVRFRGLADASGRGYGNIAELDFLAGDTSIINPPASSNQGPVAAGQATSVAEDNSAMLTLSATDADGDLLTYRVVSIPVMGALSGTPPNLTYTPAADANGSVSFTFVANDGKVDSNIATVSINVIATNDAPTANARTASTPEDTALGILLSASDKDGDSLNCRIVSGPSMGTLSGTPPNLTYIPAADANGSDSFSFVANDGKVDSNVATVSINVVAVNDAPTSSARAASTPEDTPLGILLTASDKDGDSLYYQIVSGPAKGTLSGTAPNLTYIPSLNASGTDSFSFRTNDGKADSNTATISISISPVNDAPVATAKAAGATAGTPVGIVLSATDSDGDSLTYSIVGSPTQGSLSGTAPNLTYTPNATATGTDSLSFRASDGKLNSNTATISITISPSLRTANKAPVFQADFITRPNGKVNEPYVAPSLAGTATDPDGDAVSYSKTAGPAWLSVTPDGKISGTPPAGSEGLNSFTIRAADSNSAFDEAVLQITIEAVGLPLPWSLAQIGTVSQEATAWGNATALKIKSSGSLVGSADSGIFTWQTLSGDGEITARISTLENANSSSLIGLEIRESLGINSKHVFIGTNGIGSLRFIHRTKSGTSASVSSVGIGSVPNLWLRLSRSGTTVSAFSSSNGSTWTRVGRVIISAGTSSYIGLMTCGGSNNLSTGTFENITVKP